MIRLPDLYVTIDKEFFFDLSIHIGRLRIECSGQPPHRPHRCGSTRKPVHGRTFSKGPSGL